MHCVLFVSACVPMCFHLSHTPVTFHNQVLFCLEVLNDEGGT